MTSAPIAARYRVAVGPAMTQLKSKTRIPDSGNGPVGIRWGGGSPSNSSILKGSPIVFNEISAVFDVQQRGSRVAVILNVQRVL